MKSVALGVPSLPGVTGAQGVPLQWAANVAGPPQRKPFACYPPGAKIREVWQIWEGAFGWSVRACDTRHPTWEDPYLFDTKELASKFIAWKRGSHLAMGFWRRVWYTIVGVPWTGSL